MLDTKVIDFAGAEPAKRPATTNPCHHQQWGYVGRIGGLTAVNDDLEANYEVYRFHCMRCLVFTDRRLRIPLVPA